MRRWYLGIRQWITLDSDPVSLAILPLPRKSGGLRASVAQTRRAVRDARDRAGRRNGRWRSVAIAGMASADRTAVVLIRHPGIVRADVADVLHRCWPGAIVGDVGSLSPSWEFAVEDAVELARAKRGVEPLRILVLSQRATFSEQRASGSAASGLEPMPVLL